MVTRAFVLSVVFCMFFAASASATPQIPDILIYQDQEYPLTSELMEPYFVNFPERNPKPEDFWVSALWRGYVAKLEIVEDELLLKDITVGLSNNSALQKVVPGAQPLKLDWVTGLLISMYGRNDADPYSMESLLAYERYTIFEVDTGNFKEVRHFNNRGYRDFMSRQFEAFKKTAEYKQLVEEMTEDGRLSVDDADANIKLVVLYRTKTFLVK